MPLLEVENVTKTFGGLVAVDTVTFDLEAGSILGLIGPNGAGKTTLFNVVHGVLPPDTGSIRYNGTELTERALHEMAGLGIARTYQTPQVFGDVTVADNVRIGGHLHTDNRFLRNALLGPRSTKRSNIDVDDLLDFVDLAVFRDYEAHELSYGQQRRLEIAISLATKPDLMLLDEPLAGVDPSMTESLLTLLERINEEGITIFIIEHEIASLVSIADELMVLNQGSVLTRQDPNAVINDESVIEVYLGRSE